MQVLIMKTVMRIAISLALACSFAAAQPAPTGRPGHEQERSGFVDREFRGVGGQITQISGSTRKINLRDGSIGTVNITADTRFRKSGHQAELADLKVADSVMVRGESTGDKTWTA